VHARWPALKGKGGARERVLYERAKHRFDLNAAYDLVDRHVEPKIIDQIVAHVVTAHGRGRIIMPHPAFDDEDGRGSVSNTDRPKNALPFAYAGYLSEVTGLPVDEEIVQNARVGRTKLGKFDRFLYQPTFGGTVRVDEPYIIVDDVSTTAGTLAALRSYIVRNNGTVLFASALASDNGKNREFAIRPETKAALCEAYGNAFEPYWFETVGHEVGCLTEAEGRFLGEWSNARQDEGCPSGDALLERLRARINEAAT
jgi:hypothetical protein